MVFSSTLFIFIFLPLTLLGYYLINEKFRNYWLLFVSLVFFAWSQPQYLWIILFNILINYCFAILIDRFEKFQKLFLVVDIIANLTVLYYFKYFDFTIELLNKIFANTLELQHIILPIGISFFTFQGMSYVIDVYRKDVPVQKNFFKVALYIVLFPQLIAGPIVRYKEIASEIDRRTSTLTDFSSGVERFIIGISKKAILANTLAMTADTIWNQSTGSLTWAMAWMGSIAYTLQIYFDFSGYSDMAIGLGRMFGFHFNENFNLPYISQNISEFWRRWHISLSTWFKDYVYIPLGGNRKRVYFNLAIVFILTGIWHGASLHFLAWGMWNGFFILLERFVKNHSRHSSTEEMKKRKWKIVISKVYALLVIHIGWILFRAPHTQDAIDFILVMCGIIKPKTVGYTIFWYLDRWTIFIMILSVIFSSSLPIKLKVVLKKYLPEKILFVTKYIFLLMMLYFSMLKIVSGTYNPFIYFQF